MALYLVQHGKSLPKDQDPEQGLSKEGITTVERIAAEARERGVQVSTIQHSVKQRARQTAESMASALNPARGVQEVEGLKPLDDVTVIAGKIDTAENLMLVGHLPFMERLSAFLVKGSTEPPVIRFQNGGIVCLDQEGDSQFWVLKWTLMPEMG